MLTKAVEGLRQLKRHSDHILLWGGRAAQAAQKWFALP